MNELDELRLSTGAQLLVFDLASGCTATRSGGGAPCIVMRLPGAPKPRTRGQVSDSAVQKLLTNGLAELLGEGPRQPCKLTAKGEAYYQRHLWRP